MQPMPLAAAASHGPRFPRPLGRRRRRAVPRAAVLAAIAAAAIASRARAYDQLASRFSVVAVPDPQYYTVVQWKADQYYSGQMNWIVNNAAAKNVGFVFGLGDEVQDG